MDFFFFLYNFFDIWITVNSVTMLGAADYVGTGLLFVSLGEIHINGTNAAQKTLFVVIGPRLNPFGEQFDAAFEQAERTTVLFAQALHDGQ